MMKDKTTIIVVVACLVALIGWQKVVDYFFPPTPKKPRPVASATNATTTVAGATNAVLRAPTPAAPTPAAAPAVERADPTTTNLPEQIVSLENGTLKIAFTSRGGGIQSVELLKYRNNGAGNVVLNVTNGIPALALQDLPGAGADAAYAIEQPEPRVVVMRTRTPAGIDVTKRFTLGDEYVLNGTVELVHSPTNELAIVVGTAAPITAAEPPDLLELGWLSGSKYLNLPLAKIAKKARNNQTQEPADARWVAVKNQFFTMLLNPSTNATTIGYQTTETAPLANWKSKEPPQGVLGWIRFPAVSRTEYAQSFDFTWYAGPKEFKRLAVLGDGEEEVMHFGFWGPISVVLLRSMNFFYSLIPNYGIAIILITLVIKILFWPIQAKSINSMKQMQKFQPLMAKLKEKYKDDPQRMNAEMMKLYKEHKINPFAGCLPMVVQIPVFFAFYTMLRSAIELRGASFLWIHDLALPDTIARVAGFPLNPLPLVMGVSMIAQMKLTPSGGDPKQQQIMMFMPLIFLFICYNMSSGLVLYWTVQQLLSIAQQWWSLRQVDPTPVTVPAAKSK